MCGTAAVRRVPRSLAAEIERAERAASVGYLLILEDDGERSFQAGLVENFEPISAVPDLQAVNELGPVVAANIAEVAQLGDAANPSVLAGQVFLAEDIYVAFRAIACRSGPVP